MQLKEKHQYLLFAFLSGILAWIAWPVSPFTFFIFFSFIPILWIESKITRRARFFVLVYLSMFTWNIATTWWIWNASPPGAAGAFIANSFIMCLPWLGFKITKKHLGEFAGYASLVFYWLTFEYIHLQDWGLSWPWLTLGNAFASKPAWIQWYEYTGITGGSVWVMTVNILLFLHLKKSRQTEKTNYRYLVTALLLIILPIAISPILQKKLNQAPTENVIVVQPNIDPYEKIAQGTFESQLATLISLTEQQIDDKTRLIVWPETALYSPGGIEEDNMKVYSSLRPLWDMLARHPQLQLFTGIESYRMYNDRRTNTAKPTGDGAFYDSFNGSGLLDSTGAISFYHKSMLVPGVETLPWFLKFIDRWFEKFGGTTAGYAKQEHRTVINTKYNYKIAPAICYESVYGEFMSRYFRNGANIMCIITNDGWWDNTPGHKQHMSYARLRAIENRTWVARSANTGISCFIDPNGNIIQPQPWDTQASIKLNVPTTSSQTFYTKMGDWPAKLCALIAGILIILTLFKKFTRRKNQPSSSLTYDR